MLLKAAELAVAGEQRAPVAPSDERIMARRGAPSIFVIDEELRLLFHRSDPRERRSDCLPAHGALPPLVARVVTEMLKTEGIAAREGHPCVAAPNGSIVVRLMRLEGPQTTFAVLVERFKRRDHLNLFAERYALSQREREVLALLVKGAKNAEIAHHLKVAETTAIFHVKRLLAKTDSRNRTELVAKVVG